jgi:hypothetical protein
MLQHIVLFSFPRDLGDDDWADMQSQVRSWPTEIGGIEKIRLGSSFNTERTRGYQYLLYTEFSDLDALVHYQQHPVHQKFLKWVLDRDCTALAFDYYADKDTVVI